MTNFTIKTTDSGFKWTTFTDYYKGTVRVNDSSLAVEPTLWMNLVKGQEEDHSAAICLTQGNAKELVKLLVAFIETGKLPNEV